jgi:hypothetical protein
MITTFPMYNTHYVPPDCSLCLCSKNQIHQTNRAWCWTNQYSQLNILSRNFDMICPWSETKFRVWVWHILLIGLVRAIESNKSNIWDFEKNSKGRVHCAGCSLSWLQIVPKLSSHGTMLPKKCSCNTYIIMGSCNQKLKSSKSSAVNA